jgi:general secretion pathway protein D
MIKTVHNHLPCWAMLIVLSGVTGNSWAGGPKTNYKQGTAAEARGDLDEAYRDYAAALKADPGEILYKMAMERVRQTAATQHIHAGEEKLKKGQSKDALLEFFRALEIDPGNSLAQQDVQSARIQIEKASSGQPSPPDTPSADDLDKPAGPVHLDALSKDPITLHVTESTAVLYQALGKVAGFNVLIDPDYTPKRIAVDLTNVSLSEALQVLGDLSGTFYKASTHNTIYVAADTRTKRTQLEQLAVRTFYLSNAAQQSDANDVLTMLRLVLPPTVKLFLVQSQNAIVIRGTTDEIMLAKNLIASLDTPKPEVLVDIYVMEVRRDKLRNIGISLPTSLTVTSSSSATLSGITKTSSYSYSIGQAALELLLTDSETRVLQNPRIRAIDGQKATLKIGQRIPIATGSYSTATSTTTSAVQTQFTYIDVGVNIDLTPTIHQDRDVSMKVSVEVSSESGTSTIDGVTEPIISQEKAEQVIRLKDGEVSIMAGLVQKELTHAVSGTPGLGEIPGVKYLFSTQQNETVNDEIVFMLVPHIVRAPDVNRGSAQEINTGSGDSIKIDRIGPVQSQPAPIPNAVPPSK